MILSKMAVTRPVLTTVIVAAILVLGLFSYLRLVVDLFPEIDFPFVTVTTIYPGAPTEDVEKLEILVGPVKARGRCYREVT